MTKMFLYQKFRLWVGDEGGGLRSFGALILRMYISINIFNVLPGFCLNIYILGE